VKAEQHAKLTEFERWRAEAMPERLWMASARERHGDIAV
jgi:hypothetical protein